MARPEEATIGKINMDYHKPLAEVVGHKPLTWPCTAPTPSPWVGLIFRLGLWSQLRFRACYVTIERATQTSRDKRFTWYTKFIDELRGVLWKTYGMYTIIARALLVGEACYLENGIKSCKNPNAASQQTQRSAQPSLISQPRYCVAINFYLTCMA